MKNLFLPLFFFWSHPIVFCQPGQLDETFNSTGHVITHIEGYEIYTTELLIQHDGKILVCGIGTKSTNARDFVVTRYTADGRLDSTFNESGYRVIDFYDDNDECYAMALQADDKILITGLVTTLTPKRKLGIVRLHDDGSFDETFGMSGIVIRKEEHNYSENPRAILYQEDGSIIVTGSIQAGAAPANCALFKYKHDGTPDSTFGVHGLASVNVGENFNPSLGILQEDGKIIAGGFLLGEPSESILVRFTPEGIMDSTFGTNGMVLVSYPLEDMLAYSIALQEDHKLLVVTSLNRFGQRDFCMHRFTEEGLRDSTFGNFGRVITEMVSGSNTAHGIAVQEDQKILLAGFLGTTPNHDFAMARYLPDGSLDTGFGNGGKVVTNFGEDDLAFTMAIQPDHKIVLAGHSIDDAENSDFIIARYLSGLEIVGTTMPAAGIEDAILFPNPAGRESILKYHLSKAQHVSIRLYDLSGTFVQSFGENIQKSSGMNEDILHFHPRLLPGQYVLVIENDYYAYGMPIVLE